MATQEERLEALELKVAALTHNLIATQSDSFTQFAAFNRTANTLNSMFSEQEHAIKDVHHEITILTGVIGSQGQDIKSMKEDLSIVKSDLGGVKSDLGTVKANVESLEQNVNNRFEAQDKKLDQVLLMLSKLTPRL